MTLASRAITRVLTRGGADVAALQSARLQHGCARLF